MRAKEQMKQQEIWERRFGKEADAVRVVIKADEINAKVLSEKVTRLRARYRKAHNVAALKALAEILPDSVCRAFTLDSVREEEKQGHSGGRITRIMRESWERLIGDDIREFHMIGRGRSAAVRALGNKMESTLLNYRGHYKLDELEALARYLPRCTEQFYVYQAAEEVKKELKT